MLVSVPTRITISAYSLETKNGADPYIHDFVKIVVEWQLVYAPRSRILLLVAGMFRVVFCFASFAVGAPLTALPPVRMATS